MNTKKKIFLIICGIIFFIIIIIALNINSSTNNPPTKRINNGAFKIWILDDKKEDFQKVIEGFKSFNVEYTNTVFEIESFNDYDEYEKAFATSLVLGNSPDIFVINNNGSSFLSDQSIGLSPSIVNPVDFRKKYKLVFSEDLITSYKEEGSDEEIEYLKGLPVGYETLGIYYNFRYVKSDDIKTIAGLSDKINTLNETNPDKIPIALGNGTTVYGSNDIITQFFLLDDTLGITEAEGNKLKQALGAYFVYGDVKGDNGYNSKFIELRQIGENNLNLFTKGDVLMIVGFPRLLNLISAYGYSKNLLYANPFPHYSNNTGKSLVNYNYFVINKDTKNKILADSFIRYLYGDNGAGNYLKEFPYYLPALLSLESDMLNKKINEDFNLVLGDFLNKDYDLSSFDKGLTSIFDTEIVSILDDPSNYLNTFTNLTRRILCKKDKFINFIDLSKDCR